MERPCERWDKALKGITRFQLALDNDELARFVVGESFYFLEAWVDNEEPQNIP